MIETADDKRKGFAHRGDIGDVKGISCYQKRDESQHDPARRKLRDVGGYRSLTFVT